jgi:hypothetical protein
MASFLAARSLFCGFSLFMYVQCMYMYVCMYVCMYVEMFGR